MDKLPYVEVMKSRDFDTDLHDPMPVLPGVVGSITFAPNKDAPCHDPAQVLAQSEVERLRAGNRVLLDENNQLREQLDTALATIQGLESAQ